MMQPRYAVTCVYGGFGQDIPLSAEEFSAAQRARVALSIGLGIEEKFDIALENHADLERLLLEMALERSLAIARTDEVLRHARRSTNRMLTNYLATARLYVDQVQRDIAEVLPAEANATEQVRAIIHQQHDERFGYRALEALRNHAQHRGFPVSAISFSMAREERFIPVRLRFTATPSISVTSLAQDEKFKKSVLVEMQRRADRRGILPLMPLVREHSDSLRSIHAQVRETMKTALEDADQRFANLNQRAASAFAGDTAFLSVVRYDDDGACAESERVSMEYSERRKELEVRNEDLAATAIRFVSSEY